MLESYLSDEEVERLENCAQSTAVPQLWSPDGGEPMSITDIVKNQGMATSKEGKKYRPKKWSPVGLDSMVSKWKPSGKADDEMVACACDGEGCEKCS